jgi:hypothetical protein
MKNLPIFALMALILLAASCKKSNTETPVVITGTPLIRTMVYTDTSGQYIASMSMQYDGFGRVEKMIFDNPPDRDSLVYKYEYYATMVVEKIFYRDNTKYGRNIYSLNSDGLAVSEIDRGYNTNGDSTVAQTATYKYTEGYMTEKKTFLYGDTATWTRYTWQIQNGNTHSMSLELAIWGGGMVTETYTFYPGSVNTLGNANLGKLFLGKSSVNLVKSSITDNAPAKTGNFLYNQDIYNRVTQQRIRGDGLTSNTVNVNYTYYLQIVQK